jgi:hypothetical protein
MNANNARHNTLCIIIRASNVYANKNTTSTQHKEPVNYANRRSLDASYVVKMAISAVNAMAHSNSSWTILLVSVCVRMGISNNKDYAQCAHHFIQGVRTALNLITFAPRATLTTTLFIIRRLSSVCASSCITLRRVLSVICAVQQLPIVRVVRVLKEIILPHA